MKVTKENPEIIRFIYRQEPGDDYYGSCLWAFFDIDTGHGMMSIQSDCGNYAYRWPEKGWDFLYMLSYASKSYLLSKLCGNPNMFDEKGTISRIEEYMADIEADEQTKAEALEKLKKTFQDYCLDDAPEIAQFLVDEWNDEYELEIDCAWELVHTVYETHQKKIVDIFLEHIVPEIEKIVAKGKV